MTAACATAHWMLVVRVGVIAWHLFCLPTHAACVAKAAHYHMAPAQCLRVRHI